LVFVFSLFGDFMGLAMGGGSYFGIVENVALVGVE
jgi:hypothetical protein